MLDTRVWGYGQELGNGEMMCQIPARTVRRQGSIEFFFPIMQKSGPSPSESATSVCLIGSNSSSIRIVDRQPYIVPVVPARGGAEVALGLIISIIRPFSSIELARAVHRACLLCANLLCCCCPRTWPACDHVATQHQANIFFTLHTALFTPCTSRFTLALHIPQLILSQIIWFLFTSCHLIWPLLISSHPFSHII